MSDTTTRRRGSSVSRFLQEVGNPQAKAQRRAGAPCLLFC